jgi:hypothetical protein
MLDPIRQRVEAKMRMIGAALTSFHCKSDRSIDGVGLAVH